MSGENNIKKLKPKRNGRYHQGMINPKDMKKYYSACSNDPIIYRSGLELQFINYCENNPKVSKWASEPVKIPYFSRLKQRESNYYPDYVIENEDGVRCIVEIKPYNQTVKPGMTDSRWLKEAWIMNVDKWTAAKEFADKHNMKFIVVTEKFFE